VRQLKIKVTDCSYNDLVKAAQKCGFIVRRGGKHAKVKTIDGKFITTIPCHSRIKRETARGIAESFKQFGAKIIY